MIALLVAGGLFYRSHKTQPSLKDTIFLSGLYHTTGDPVFDSTLRRHWL